MTSIHASAAPPRFEWRTITALLALCAVPVAAGAVRLHALAAGGPVNPANLRFFQAPLPISVHIVSATLYCVLGALQFSTSLRLRYPRSHRMGGVLAASCAVLAALTGVSMTLALGWSGPLQGPLLWGARLLSAGAMALAIAVGLAAIARRQLRRHRLAMLHAWAIGAGAGTQVLVSAPFLVFQGSVDGLLRDALMAAGWLINLAVAQWLSRRRPR